MYKKVIPMVEIETEIVSRGHSFGFKIPKALLDCKILEKGKRYKIWVLEAKTEKPLNIKTIQDRTYPAILKGKAFGYPYEIIIKDINLKEMVVLP